MATAKTTILVYAHWAGMATPKLIGILSALQLARPNYKKVSEMSDK